MSFLKPTGRIALGRLTSIRTFEKKRKRVKVRRCKHCKKVVQEKGYIHPECLKWMRKHTDTRELKKRMGRTAKTKMKERLKKVPEQKVRRGRDLLGPWIGGDFQDHNTENGL